MNMRRWVAGWLTLGLTLAGGAAGAEKTVGENASAAGALLRLEGGKWRAVGPRAAVAAGDTLMALPGVRAEIDCGESGLRVGLWGAVPELASFPVFESVVRLEGGRENATELTLERGRIVLANRGGRGETRARVGFLGKVHEVGVDAGSEVAFELLGRWPPGSAVGREPAGGKAPAPDEQPRVSVFCTVLKGEASLKVGADEFRLRAPPGRSAFHWDSVNGPDAGPERRALPFWAEEPARSGAEAKAIEAAAERLRRALGQADADGALREALTADDKTERELAVYGLAAVDDLPVVIGALADSKHADVREAAAEALRAWIGRGAGQDAQLLRALRDEKYTASQAEIVLQLLHGYARADRARPETYEALIAYLNSGKAAVRELARWHLYRWVPEARDIPYDATASEEERTKGYEAWRKLLKEGRLPPRDKR